MKLKATALALLASQEGERFSWGNRSNRSASVPADNFSALLPPAAGAGGRALKGKRFVPLTQF